MCNAHFNCQKRDRGPPWLSWASFLYHTWAWAPEQKFQFYPHGRKKSASSSGWPVQIYAPYVIRPNASQKSSPLPLMAPRFSSPCPPLAGEIFSLFLKSHALMRVFLLSWLTNRRLGHELFLFHLWYFAMHFVAIFGAKSASSLKAMLWPI